MFIERFIRYVRYEKRFSPHTIKAYETDLLQFQTFLTTYETTLAEATHTLVRSWVMECMEASTGAKSINRKISSLRSFYKFLQREGLVVKSPMEQVQAPKIPKRLPVIVEEAKLNTLLDDEALFPSGFEGLRDRVVLELLYGTGIRLAELLGLKNSDIDDYNQQIKVLGKRNKERILPLAKPLYALLKVYIDQKNELGFTSTDKLIVTDKGTAAYPQLIYRLVKQALGEVSTQDKKSPHILRHSFATALLNKGAELTAIKELLGHANLSATQVYTHNSIEKLKSIYKQAHPKA
jgi:integrase/recombinase XerC